MGAVNIDRLKLPKKPYDVKKWLRAVKNSKTGRMGSAFETIRETTRERRRRIRSLNAAAKKVADGSLSPCGAFASLADDLKAAESRRGHESFADPVFMRLWRRRLIGQLWAAVAKLIGCDVYIYTLVRANSAIPADNLINFAPKKLLEMTRLELDRAGMSRLSGWAILFIHGDYDSRTDTYQPHIHAIVVGKKAKAFEALRKLSVYEGGAIASVRAPIKRQRLRHPARQLSYLFQQFWPHKPSVMNPNTGRAKRARGRSRIPEPRHAEWLVWFAAQKFSDLSWFHRIAMRNGTLTQSPD